MDFVFKSSLCIKSLCIIHVILASNLHEMVKANFISTNMGQAKENVNRSVHLSNHHHLAIRCSVHSNCTQRIFVLDSYCCQTSELCCSWFEYVLNYDAKLTSVHTLPYKGPTLLTIFALLIGTIVALFVFYCLLITVCYCCKCGLFKKPNIVVINETSTHSHGSDVTSAEIITPKSSSSSASSSLSSSDISYTSSNNRHHRHQIYNEQRHNKKSYSGGNIGLGGKRYTNVKKSPKARAYVNESTSVLANTSHNLTSRHNNAAARLYADPNCYVDYDNDSPFLAPTESNKYSRRSNPPTSRYSGQRRGEANATTNSTANNSRRSARQLSMTNQRNENMIVSTRNGTVLDPFDDELATVNSQIININEATSSGHTTSGSESGAEEVASSPSRSSSSIDFELPNAASALSVNNPTANHHHHHHHHHSAATAVDSSKTTSVPSYYLDEKPPSYDDIINNRK